MPNPLMRKIAQVSLLFPWVLPVSAAAQGGLHGVVPPAPVQLPQADRECAPGANMASSASCDLQWNLKQTGLLEAWKLVRDVRGEVPAGNGVVIAQVDTGVIDQPETDSPHNGDVDLRPDQMHPMLRPGPGAPHRIVITTRDGRRLPLSFYADPKGRRSGCSAADHLGQECAARDTSAEVAPRDFLESSHVPGLSQVASAFQQPGHGTHTMSVLLQAAPGASVVPYKFTGGVFLTQGRSTQLALALHAIALEDRLAEGSGRMDVATMSVGRRSPAVELENAVRVAEMNGIILVAAAGQLPVVKGSHTRFPAQYDGVIAVTGTRLDLKPWPYAGRGPRNAVAAPAAGVWRASWEREGKRLIPTFGRGNGTSFATPLVAATASLWIQYHTRAVLESRYGRAALPAAFRWVLTREGVRTPAEICRDLLKPSENPEWVSICGAEDIEKRGWDTASWGRGILAADKVLRAPLPDAADVCQDVMEHRGPTDYALVCPPGSPGYRAEHLALGPQIERPAPRTLVTGVSALGSPFGRGAGITPTVSLGVIWSEHEIEAPRGLFTQAEIGHRGDFKLGLGGAFAAEYSPQGHSRHLEVGALPGFGPAIGFALKAIYIRTREEVAGGSGSRNWLGPELEVVFYRWRLQIASVRPIDSSGKGWRMAWSLGHGF